MEPQTQPKMKPLDKALIVLSVLVALFAAQHLYALSCMPAPSETAELESVEVDGQPSEDLTAYDGYDGQIGVTTSDQDEATLRVRGEPAGLDDLSYLQRVHRQSASSDE